VRDIQDLKIHAGRLEGYLAAVAALRGDGTSFACLLLGMTPPAAALASLCEAFALSIEHCKLVPCERGHRGVPPEFARWVLNRVRPSTPEDRAPLEPSLLDGLIEELQDAYDEAPEWYVLHRSVEARSDRYLGAFSDVFVCGDAAASFALHCSWDS